MKKRKSIYNMQPMDEVHITVDYGKKNKRMKENIQCIYCSITHVSTYIKHLHKEDNNCHSLKPVCSYYLVRGGVKLLSKQLRIIPIN